MSCYDEFSLLEDNADEFGLPWTDPPEVRRDEVHLDDGRRVSAIRWGAGDPELVLLHGGAQNAHTWDTVALALDRPLLAVDLPGHGHSDWREDRDYTPGPLADDVAPAVAALAPKARTLVGMSLGGLTAITLAARRPDLLTRLVVVDVTPMGRRETEDKGREIADFVSGPESFASFDELLERTVAHHPHRSRRSLERGALHNARQREDGRWEWRYDRRPSGRDRADSSEVWDSLEQVRAPTLLVRGARSRVVTDEDVEELRRARPDAEVVVVADAGHSIQGDQPLELARVLDGFDAGVS